MNDLEQRLQNAAEETRRLARTRPVAPPRARPGTQRHGLAIFATAFAVVIVLFGVLPWVFGGTETPALDDGASTTSLESTTSAPITDPACSASGIATPSPAPGLPEPAASTRSAIANAAAACDLGALESLASDIFTTSYGGGGVENLARWETDGEGRLGILLELLNMTYGTIEGGETTIYVWPAAFAHDTWEEIPEELVAELSEIYTREELDQFESFGSYGGWRTGIDEDGIWTYFIAGD